MADTLSKTIEGLQPGGEYIIQVRSKNGANDYSEWSQALSYTAPLVSNSSSIQNTLPTTFNATANGGQHFFQGAFGVPTQPALISIKNSSVPAVNPGSAGKYVLGVLDTFAESSGIVQPYQLVLQLPFIVAGQSGGVNKYWKFVIAKNTASGNPSTSSANGMYGITASGANAIATPGQVYFAVQNNANNSVSTVYNLFNTSGNTNQIAYLYDNSGNNYLLQSPAAISAASQTSSAPTGSTYFYLDTASGTGWSGTTISGVNASIAYYPSVTSTILASQFFQPSNYDGGGMSTGGTLTAIDWNPGTSPLNYYAYFQSDNTNNPGSTLEILTSVRYGTVFSSPIVFAAWPIFTGAVYNSI